MRASIPRRTFMGLAAGLPAAFFLGTVTSCQNSPTAPANKTLTLNTGDPLYSSLSTVGNSIKITDPNNSLRPLIVIRTAADAVTVFSSACTLEGCELPLPAGGLLACLCCGSQYDTSGAVTHGPATKKLTGYPAEVSGSTITIHTDQPIQG